MIPLNELYKEMPTGLKDSTDPVAQFRRKGFERFQALGFPTRKMEAWKYANLGPLLSAKFEEGVLPFSCGRVPPGMQVEDLGPVLAKNGGARASYFSKGIAEEPNPFVAINTFCFDKALLIHIPRDAKIEEPFRVGWGNPVSAAPFAAHPRILVTAEEGSSARLIFHEAGGLNREAFINTVFEFQLGRGSRVHFIHIQEEEKSARRFFSSRFYLGASSELRVTTYSEGGALDRHETLVSFEGEGASCHISDLAILEGNLRAFHHASVHHRTRGCLSRQLFKTILGGESQAEINSLSFVHPGAKGSDSNQLNRNLLLSDKAKIWSRPQLKIYNDDVKATHGSATGPIEGQELFYLQSRGLSLETARYLLVYGFAEEVLQKMEDPELYGTLKKRLSDKIDRLMK